MQAKISFARLAALLLFLSAIWTYSQDDSIFGNPLRDAYLLPTIEHGIATGRNPKSVKLLEFVIGDYKTRGADTEIKALTYSIFAGIAKGVGGRISHDGGRFGYKNLPAANYVVIFGEALDESLEAVIVGTFSRSDGSVKRVVYNLEWDGSVWKVRKRVETQYSQEVKLLNQESNSSR